MLAQPNVWRGAAEAPGCLAGLRQKGSPRGSLRAGTRLESKHGATSCQAAPIVPLKAKQPAIYQLVFLSTFLTKKVNLSEATESVLSEHPCVSFLTKE